MACFSECKISRVREAERKALWGHPIACITLRGWVRRRVELRIWEPGTPHPTLDRCCWEWQVANFSSALPKVGALVVQLGKATCQWQKSLDGGPCGQGEQVPCRRSVPGTAYLDAGLRVQDWRGRLETGGEGDFAESFPQARTLLLLLINPRNHVRKWGLLEPFYG